MKAALLPDRGVVKVAGDDARKFLNGLVTVDTVHGRARTCALYRAADAAGQDHRRFHRGRGRTGRRRRLLPRLLRARSRQRSVQRLNFYKLRAKVMVEDLSETLGVLAIWDGTGGYRIRSLLSPTRACRAGRALHAAASSRRRRPPPISAPTSSRRPTTRRIGSRSACRAAGSTSSTATPFRTRPTWISFAGVDFDKGCFVGQEVVSRIEHRGIARTRVVPVAL